MPAFDNGGCEAFSQLEDNVRTFFCCRMTSVELVADHETNTLDPCLEMLSVDWAEARKKIASELKKITSNKCKRFMEAA